MRQKLITKAQDAAFSKALHTLASHTGFRAFPPDPHGHGCGKDRMQWIMTDCGRYFLHTETSNAGSHALWIFGRFEDPEKLPDRHESRPSGKLNFYGYDQEQALREFSRAMTIYNARPATPEEVAAFDAADLAEYDEWQLKRKSWNEYLRYQKRRDCSDPLPPATNPATV